MWTYFAVVSVVRQVEGRGVERREDEGVLGGAAAARGGRAHVPSVPTHSIDREFYVWCWRVGETECTLALVWVLVWVRVLESLRRTLCSRSRWRTYRFVPFLSAIGNVPCSFPSSRSHSIQVRVGDAGKSKEREELARSLRREADRGVVRLRPVKMLELLESAALLRGAGRIAVDALRGKTVLQKRYGCIACCSYFQRWARGLLARKTALPSRRDKCARHFTHQLERRKRCSATATFARRLKTQVSIEDSRAVFFLLFPKVFFLGEWLEKGLGLWTFFESVVE